eukprot:2235192-Pyramimonas_sp.AAC.1
MYTAHWAREDNNNPCVAPFQTQLKKTSRGAPQADRVAHQDRAGGEVCILAQGLSDERRDAGPPECMFASSA